MTPIVTMPGETNSQAAIRTNKLIRNTYTLLSASLLFSAAMAMLALYIGIPYIHPFLTIGVYFALLFAVSATCRSAWGLLWLFALTGFMGATLGPLINFYLTAYSNGAQLVAIALGGTGVIFLSLSGYAMVTRKNFSFLGGFIMVGFIVVILAMLANYFLQIPGLQLAASAAVILLSSGLILYETSNLIHRPGMNYILATLSLFIAIYNIFISLLHILGALAGNRN